MLKGSVDIGKEREKKKLKEIINFFAKLINTDLIKIG